MLYQELSEGLVELIGALDEVEVSNAQVGAVLSHLAADGEVAKLARAVAMKYAGDCELNVAAAGLLRAISDTVQKVPNLDNVKSLAESGQKIAAVKAYRQETGAGLKESKEYVESLMPSEPELGAVKLVEEPQEDTVDLEDDDDDVQETASPSAAPTVRSFYSGQNVVVNGSLYKGPGTVKRTSVSEDKVYVRCTNDGKLRSYNSADIAAGKLSRA